MTELKLSVIKSGNIDISLEKGVVDTRPSCTLLRMGLMNMLVDLADPQEDPDVIVEGLAEAGLSPSDILYVIFTHLHPDHFGHSNLFKNSTFIFHADEKLSFVFKNHKKIELSGSSVFGITENCVTGPMKAKAVPDFNKLGNSIYLHHCPGHTPGSMAIFVNISGNVYAIVGDIFLNEEYYKEMKIPGSTWREAPIPDQMKFIKANSDIIIPGHGEPFKVNRLT